MYPKFKFHEGAPPVAPPGNKPTKTHLRALWKLFKTSQFAVFTDMMSFFDEPTKQGIIGKMMGQNREDINANYTEWASQKVGPEDADEDDDEFLSSEDEGQGGDEGESQWNDSEAFAKAPRKRKAANTATAHSHDTRHSNKPKTKSKPSGEVQSKKKCSRK